ncbi:MAG TPA: c-type cytochrome [Aliidongia sp.]|nr:c-type cytochrome [Aliidongia sp.]
MTKPSAACWLALACVLLCIAAGARAQEVPEWAYPINPPGPDVPDPPDDLHSLPGSAVQFSSSQLDDLFTAPDWYPNDHPPLPPLVAHGAPPTVYACGYCHQPNGFGRPENASLAGLPATYIIRQVEAFGSGTRRSSVPDRIPAKFMAELSGQAARDPGLAEVARYFASIKPKAVIRVVEAEQIPRTEVAGWVLKRADGGETEPIGERVVEIPDDFARFEERDPRLTYTAFVPPGSIARGEALVKTGAGKTVGCALCHGATLRGQDGIPPLAGRSPSYLARQLYDMQSGARRDAETAAMKRVVAKLGNAEMVAITAYLASLPP